MPSIRSSGSSPSGVAGLGFSSVPGFGASSGFGATGGTGGTGFSSVVGFGGTTGGTGGTVPTGLAFGPNRLSNCAARSARPTSASISTAGCCSSGGGGVSAVVGFGSTGGVTVEVGGAGAAGAAGATGGTGAAVSAIEEITGYFPIRGSKGPSVFPGAGAQHYARTKTTENRFALT